MSRTSEAYINKLNEDAMNAERLAELRDWAKVHEWEGEEDRRPARPPLRPRRTPRSSGSEPYFRAMAKDYAALKAENERLTKRLRMGSPHRSTRRRVRCDRRRTGRLGRGRNSKDTLHRPAPRKPRPN
ncbi:MAG: hypothetical protein MZV70_03355 [Desulfobacterales bacterium]|nr:hypothetical protein [Desulfobacterales bacterium]